MNFELLPNEILLDLFDYFNGTDLLQAFHGLNSRFNFLLYKQFRLYCLDFSSVSKRHFDMICQQHLPFIADQIIAFCFSDMKETPEQINLFIYYIPSFKPFTRLRSLTLYGCGSYGTLVKLLDECHHLSSLTHLFIYSCFLSIAQVDYQLIVDKIWSLPKLTNCDVDINFNEQQIFCVPTVVSPSIQCVSIFHGELEWTQINRLFKHTPRLKYLFTFIKDTIDDNYVSYSYPTLTILNICFLSSCDISQMIAFFQGTPNLRRLDISTWSELIYGHQWEQIIRNHLPKLKTLRLEMKGKIFNDQTIEEEANKLLDSFRSSFWMDEHRWFVRCFTSKTSIYLYTLSVEHNYYSSMVSDYWQSTYPHDNQQEFYKTMTSIYNKTFFDQPISFNICLPNIKYLHIELPINDQFWSIVPNLNQLGKLSISSHTDTFQSELQILLDRAPHLARLAIGQDASLPLQMSLFKYTSASVRDINLRDCNHDFNEEECIALTRSPLGGQCEVLSIRVNNYESIINLLKNMLNLRALIVKCADDEYYKQSILTNNNDEGVQWLRDHLPSTYLITRDLEEDRNKDVFQCLPLKVSIESSLEDANIPGLALIVINSTNILYEETFGYNSPPILNERQSIDSTKTIFVLASISKTFIAVAVMQLVELHHLDLDNDINQYLSPNMKVIHPFYSNISITMRHLLSHTSGIGPNFNEEIKHYVPNDDFIKTNLSDIIFTYINNKSNWLPNPPGTIVYYSNIGASLAALIVELVAQVSFEEYVRENILQPLGINKKDAGYRLSDFENRKNDLINHYIFNSSWLEQAQNWLPQLNITQVSNNSNWLYIPHYSVSDYPSGLLRMSAHSLAIYLQSFLNNFPSLLSNLSSFEEMIRVPTDLNSEVQFSLIWNWRNINGKRFIGHRGAMPGITHLMMANENRSLGVIILSNGDITKNDSSSVKVYDTLANLLTQLFDCFE